MLLLSRYIFTDYKFQSILQTNEQIYIKKFNLSQSCVNNVSANEIYGRPEVSGQIDLK